MPTPSSPHLLSGGHKGAEAEFGRAAKRWGIAQTTLSFDGHDMEWPHSVRVLADEELAKGDVSMEIVCRRMGRTYHESARIRRVVQSIFHMVNDAHQLFAVGWVQPDDTVKGGTGWAVELAKLFNRPVAVFDQGRNFWLAWHSGRWEPEAPAIGRQPFCGTGTRHLTEEGRAAIADLFRRSFGAPPE
jgi:hypothetical protein